MNDIDTVLYTAAAALQLAAMFFAARMAREVNDRRPWLVLFAALFIMFALRIVALWVPASTRQHFGPWSSIIISTLLFISLFFIQRVAIAERQSKALAELRGIERDESESRYRALVDLSPDAEFVTTAGKIVYANVAALNFFGAQNPEELMGRSPLDFASMQTKLQVEGRLQQLTEIGQSHRAAPEEWIRLDGSRVPVEAVRAVVPWRGGKAMQVILRDVSERRRAEEEKTALLASERAARSAAEHASRMKDEFLATLSHELRTPLNAILGWSHILRQGSMDETDLKQGLETIERNARVQTQLIEDLLDMSRIISGKLRLDAQSVEPISFIDAAMETIRPTAQAKGVHLERELDTSAGPVWGDPGRLQQVVWNLLSNAVKFTPAGGRVSIGLQRIESHIEIRVQDTGQGIDAQFLPYVFDRFRQADPTTTRKFGGLGLGLAIAKQLVELHGGEVRVQSDGLNKGSTFLVLLPVKAAAQFVRATRSPAPADVVVEPTPTPAQIDLSGLKVLVVDDENDACILIQRALRDYKAEVVTAQSAKEGLALVESARPDILVSDIGMPEIDGYEFLRRVRILTPERGGKTPAIALTAFARSEDRTRALMAGYSVHVAKPVEPNELIVTVASLAGRTGVT
jgi:PAS domain S-box-containing protein